MYEKCVLAVGKESQFSCNDKTYFDQVFDYMKHGLSLNESILAMKYNYHYSENIDLNNTILKSLRSIVRKAEKSNFKILFYLTPINLESIYYYSGKKLVNIIDNNLLTISNTLKGKNIYFLNLIDLLNKDYFELECACEHIDNKGKNILINYITAYINTKIGNI